MDDESLSFLQAIKKWPRVSLYSGCLTLNVLLWGYDTAIVGGLASMPVFQQVFGERFDDKYIITSLWLALWSIATPIGSMIGAVFGGWIQDLVGRRWTLGIGGILSILAIAVCYVSDLTSSKNAALFGGKLFEGVAIGTIMCSTQTLLSEIVPGRLRGPIFALFPALQLVGQLVAGIVQLLELNAAGRKSYRTAIASEWPLSIFPLLLALLVPESPVWLLHKGNTPSARNAFWKLHGRRDTSVHQKLLDEMQTAVSEERWAAHDKKATYLECFRGANLRRTLIVVFAGTIPELFGLTLLGHVAYFLQLLGLSHSSSFILLILGVVLGIFANIGSFWILLKFGRRSILLVTLAIVTVIWASIGVAGIWSGKTVALYSAVGMMAIVVSAGIGAWPASFVVASETSSLRLRSKTQGTGWLIAGIARCGFGVGFPYLYNSDAADLGAKTGWVLFGTAGAAFLITYLVVPELKGRSAVDIDRLFEERLSTRQFRTSGWERVEDEDTLALRNASSGISRSDGSQTSLQAGGVQAFEPLRRRPTA